MGAYWTRSPGEVCCMQFFANRVVAVVMDPAQASKIALLAPAAHT